MKFRVSVVRLWKSSVIHSAEIKTSTYYLLKKKIVEVDITSRLCNYLLELIAHKVYKTLFH